MNESLDSLALKNNIDSNPNLNTANHNNINKKIIIKTSNKEIVVAVTENKQLVEIYFERNEQKSIASNIYKGVVENVLPGMQAAFIDIGLEKNGFLYINDALPRQMQDDNSEYIDFAEKYSIDDILKSGQEILVQIIKEPVGTKGARVTTNPTLPGRYVVLMPTVDYVGISRRIEDEDERERLKKIGENIVPQDMGIIIRTVAEGCSEEKLAVDIKKLVKQWKRIQNLAYKSNAPKLIHHDLSFLERIARDIFTKDVDEIIVNSADTKEQVESLFTNLGKELDFTLKNNIEIAYNDDIFNLYDINLQVEKALRRKVWLKSGGYLIVDQMEALTAIDVNTGKFVGENNLADTVLKTNEEAAIEIARQLRLRNIGGIIIIDFIDMGNAHDKEQLIEAFTQELKKDRTKTNLLGLTELGLLEMTRKKTGYELSNILQRDCPFCDGRGKVLSEESVSLKVNKEILKLALDTIEPAIYVETNPVVAAYLIGPSGSNLEDLEKTTGKKIIVRGDSSLKMNKYIIRAESDIAAAEETRQVKPNEIIKIIIEEAHDENPENGIGRVDGFIILVKNAGDKIGKYLNIKIDNVYRTYARGHII